MKFSTATACLLGFSTLSVAAPVSTAPTRSTNTTLPSLAPIPSPTPAFLLQPRDTNATNSTSETVANDCKRSFCNVPGSEDFPQTVATCVKECERMETERRRMRPSVVDVDDDDEEDEKEKKKKGDDKSVELEKRDFLDNMSDALRRKGFWVPSRDGVGACEESCHNSTSSSKAFDECLKGCVKKKIEEIEKIEKKEKGGFTDEEEEEKKKKTTTEPHGDDNTDEIANATKEQACRVECAGSPTDDMVDLDLPCWKKCLEKVNKKPFYPPGMGHGPVVLPDDDRDLQQ